MADGAVVAKAWVEIIPEMSGIRGAIAEELGAPLESESKSAGQRSGQGFADSFKSAIGTLGAIAAALGLKELVTQAAEAADATQKFKTTLDFAGLGTAEIEALTESTRAYADATVYSLSDIQNITAQLAANGVEGYDRLAEAAGNLNAVAGGNVDTFQSVGMVLTQTAGLGKLTTENWNQLSEAIPGASGKLQEALLANGAYTGNFREAMEQGEITAEEFNQAIMDLGFTDAAIEAAQSTTTFEGAIGNLEAAVVGGLSDVLTQIQPAITGAINAITPVMETAFSGINAAVSALLAQGPALQSFFQPLIDAGTQLVTTVQPLLASFGASLGTLMASLATTMQPVVSAFMALFTTSVNIATSVASVLIPIIQQVVDYVSGTLLPTIQPVIAAITTTVTTAMPLIQTAISTALTAIQTVWGIVWPAIQAVIEAVWPVIQSVIETVMNVINGIITTVTGIISGDWSAVWSGISSVASSIWSGIQSIVSSAISAVSSVISTVINTISSIWSSIWGSIKSFFGDIWNGIKSAAQSGIDTVYNTVTGIKDKIVGFFSGAGQWLYNAGKSILEGLGNGIRNAISGVTSIVSGALDTIRGFFPFSPAKVGPFSGHGYTTWSGKALMEDWGKGIDVGTGAATDYAADAANRVRAALDVRVGKSGAYSPQPVEYGGGATSFTINGLTVGNDQELRQALTVVADRLSRRAAMGRA